MCQEVNCTKPIEAHLYLNICKFHIEMILTQTGRYMSKQMHVHSYTVMAGSHYYNNPVTVTVIG